MVGNIGYRKLLEGLLEQASDPRSLVNLEEPKVIEIANEQLVQLAKLASIGELVSGVAHEINNPLAIVIGYSELLLKEDVDHAARERLQIISEQSQRACRMIDDLRSFAGWRTAVKSFVDVRDPLERVLRLPSYKLRGNNIELIKELSEALPMIMANDDQLAQVFLNLVTNAEQAISTSNNGGRLTVKAATQDNHIRITIQDDGPGIAPEHQDQIFDLFFTTKPLGKGAGLGLNLCLRIVDEHGGKIWLDRRPQAGAAFFVDLPINSVPPRETSSQTKVQERERGGPNPCYLCVVTTGSNHSA